VGIISKSAVLELIVSFLGVGKRGFKRKLCMSSVVLLILKRVKTGCQWRELCIKEYFEEGEVTWQTIYYYFNKWSKYGSFRNAWTTILEKHKYFDAELYNKNRYKVEQSSAWIHPYKGVLVRYEKLRITWQNVIWLCITAIFIKK
jgi:transposase